MLNLRRLIVDPNQRSIVYATDNKKAYRSLDAGLNWGLERLGKKSSAKGMVVTADDLGRSRKTFRAYSAIYPLVWAFTRLDAVVPASGYMLIASARRRAS